MEKVFTQALTVVSAASPKQLFALLALAAFALAAFAIHAVTQVSKGKGRE